MNKRSQICAWKKVELCSQYVLLRACALAGLGHFQYEPACRNFQSRYFHFWDQTSMHNTHYTDTEADGHDLIDSKFDSNQEYIYFIRFLKVSFEYCKHYPLHLSVVDIKPLYFFSSKPESTLRNTCCFSIHCLGLWSSWSEKSQMSNVLQCGQRTT